MDKDYIYTKYWNSAISGEFSIWKVTVDKADMMCIYDERKGVGISYVDDMEVVKYEKPTGNWREHEITEGEAFLIML